VRRRQLAQFGASLPVRHDRHRVPSVRLTER
jgi:hypothetical protein